MEKMHKEVLAMYDIRGIQKYIFRTDKVKDAIGASAIVENIIADALREAVDNIASKWGIAAEKQKLQWCTEDEKGGKREAIFYESNMEDGIDIQVLYIGGGNALVTYSSGELCLEINKVMAKYVLDKTYSLQLAAAMVEKTSNYNADSEKLYAEMDKVKADMRVSKPLGALPIMEVEVKTGYPMINREGSKETNLKKKKEEKIRESIQTQLKIFDNYVLQKGVDSTLAVVHIDGNNMGLRIKGLIKDKKDYVSAVNEMRNISLQISSSYKNTYEVMEKEFNNYTQNFVMKILVAGDDITYICNAKIAIKTVEYFCKEISKHTLNGKTDEEDIKKYGFSVCAGIAYFQSHFPFNIAYEVAEQCCDSAKARAKKEENKDIDRIGNFVDFQICKNIQTSNLEETREREYKTSRGEQLLIRPYFVNVDDVGFSKLLDESYSLDKFKIKVKYFQNDKKIPKSFAKDMRNTYSLGEDKIKKLWSFISSRGFQLPAVSEKSGKSEELYFVDGKVKTARWYDALEMIDLIEEETDK